MGHCCFLSDPFKFVIHQSSYHSKLIFQGTNMIIKQNIKKHFRKVVLNNVIVYKCNVLNLCHQCMQHKNPLHRSQHHKRKTNVTLQIVSEVIQTFKIPCQGRRADTKLKIQRNISFSGASLCQHIWKNVHAGKSSMTKFHYPFHAYILSVQ